MLPTVQTTPTEATCGEDCWGAREDVCRCSCRGRNHGVLRSADGVRPSRTRRIKDRRYRLIGSTSSFGLDQYYATPGNIVWNRATAKQLLWPEIRPAAEERQRTGTCVGDCDTHLLWQLIDEEQQ